MREGGRGKLLVSGWGWGWDADMRLSSCWRSVRYSYEDNSTMNVFQQAHP